jgi:hypothetical protein
MPILPLASLAPTSIDHIVSLGRACETAYNLRRHYNFSTAYPFDWWISTTDGVARFIADGDGTALYDPDALRLAPKGDSVVNPRYGIRLHHEFPRQRDATGQPVAAGWAEYVPAARERTDHLTRRLFGTGGSLVFMRTFGPRDGDEAAVAALLAALDARFPAAQIGVVLVNFRGRAPAGYATQRLAVERPAGADWRGDGAAWDRALATLGLRLTPGLHRPAAPADLSAHIAARAAADHGAGEHSQAPSQPVSVEP